MDAGAAGTEVGLQKVSDAIDDRARLRSPVVPNLIAGMMGVATTNVSDDLAATLGAPTPGVSLEDVASRDFTFAHPEGIMLGVIGKDVEIWA